MSHDASAWGGDSPCGDDCINRSTARVRSVIAGQTAVPVKKCRKFHRRHCRNRRAGHVSAQEMPELRIRNCRMPHDRKEPATPCWRTCAPPDPDVAQLVLPGSERAIEPVGLCGVDAVVDPVAVLHEACRVLRRNLSWHAVTLRADHATLQVSPPSTTSSAPVMYFASSDARNSAALATSQASPMRPIGTISSR